MISVISFLTSSMPLMSSHLMKSGDVVSMRTCTAVRFGSERVPVRSDSGQDESQWQPKRLLH